MILRCIQYKKKVRETNPLGKGVGLLEFTAACFVTIR